jgi:hypothetical protein
VLLVLKGLFQHEDHEGGTKVTKDWFGRRVCPHGLDPSDRLLTGLAASAGMCHLGVAERRAATRGEKAKLVPLPLVRRDGRLSCRIIWRDDLDSLEVALPKVLEA